MTIHEKSERPLVSVIIVNYNGLRFLKTCLDSIALQNYDQVETIFVDNGSTDGSVDLVKLRYPWVRVIQNNANLGFAAGNNIGIKAASGQLIATLNNDTEAEPGWITALVAAMRQDGIGMCASKILYMNDRGRIDSTGIEISRSGACWDRGMLQPDDGRFDSKCEVFGPCAGAAMYRKQMMDESGLFDGDFFAYMEDVDLAFRGQMAGWKCLYVPDAVVYHYHGGTAGYMSDFSIYYGNRNIIWNVFKNYPASLLATSLPFIIGRNLAVIPFYIVKGHGIAAVRSKIDALLGLPALLKKRRHWPEENRIPVLMKNWAHISKPRK